MYIFSSSQNYKSTTIFYSEQQSVKYFPRFPLNFLKIHLISEIMNPSLTYEKTYKKLNKLSLKVIDLESSLKCQTEISI